MDAGRAMRPPRIALATCGKLPEPDHDERPLSDALGALGAEVAISAWDDPSVDWARFDLCVIRSTWNYVHRLPEFLSWAKRTSRVTRLANPWELVRWNSDKRYLKDMEARGIRIVPTVFCPRGSARPLSGILARSGWTDVVIKPQVGAASFMTRRFSGRLAAAENFLRRVGAERDMLIQPYVPSVETRGEHSLVYVSGRLTHAVRKSPRLAGGREGVSSSLPITRDERRFALRALKPFRDGILYARVDVARAADGGLMLMELELIEPSLFLLQNPRALRLFARSCVRLCPCK